jgi:rubrerythrin
MKLRAKASRVNLFFSANFLKIFLPGRRAFMRLPDNNQFRKWSLADIDFSLVDKELARADEFLFLTLASSSFTEMLSETYSRNLLEHFNGDAKVTDWLEQSWQKDEMQHGHALKAYVNTVWPEFNWDEAYAAFYREYGALCTVEQLEQQRSLELFARCVVETGTSTFYRALLSYAREPVLRQIIAYIMTDETSHYAHFREYFASYNARERHGVKAILLTMWRRLNAISGEDAYIALKHVHNMRYPKSPFNEADWRNFNRAVKHQARHHYPYSMAAKMLVNPIPLYEPVKRSLRWMLLGIFRIVSLS